jgi:hypothetical protein
MQFSIYLLLGVVVISARALNITPSILKSRSSKAPALPTDRDILLQAISGLNYGVKATKSDNAKIEQLVAALTLSAAKKSVKFPADAFSADSGGRNQYQRSIFGGKWELQYTNGPDVLSIAKIPGVTLDYVGQVVDTESNVITNLVNASGFLADTAQEVSVGVRQVSPNKVELDFVGKSILISEKHDFTKPFSFEILLQVTVFSFLNNSYTGTKIKLLKIFGQTKIFGKVVDDIKPFEIKFDKEKLDKTLKDSGRPVPAFEILYLDDTLRIQRTSEGYLFIIKKIMEAGTETKGGGGLGPWLENKIGENGMKTLGWVSLTPYLFFAITAVREFLEAR